MSVMKRNEAYAAIILVILVILRPQGCERICPFRLDRHTTLIF